MNIIYLFSYLWTSEGKWEPRESNVLCEGNMCYLFPPDLIKTIVS